MSCHSVYPAGYHCDPKLPLLFISIASQKNHIGLYHMGLASSKLMDGSPPVPQAQPAQTRYGEERIRFKKSEHVPLQLIGELVGRMNSQQWIELYEKNIRS